MNTVYILIGLPGSGKTTWASKKCFNEENTIIVSRDALRSMIKANKYVFDKKYESLICQINDDAFYTALRGEFDIILDETNISMIRRKSLVSIIKEYDFFYKNKTKIVYVMFTEQTNNLENRMKEDRGYSKETWNNVINLMKNNFDYPDKQYEEYDELIEITPKVIKNECL